MTRTVGEMPRPTSNGQRARSNIRWGLCCQFFEHPIRFRSAVATYALRLDPALRREKLSALCLENADALRRTLDYCRHHDIGCFRVNSQILPLKTHPAAGYAIDELPHANEIEAGFRECKRIAVAHDIRLCFHPDQYVVLNSPREDVVQASLQELVYHGEVAEWIGADTINIHAGGAYGNKRDALQVLERNLDRLPSAVRDRLTIENDDRIFSPADLLPLCRSTGIPLVYDAHHHRCHSDALSLEEASEAAIETWPREPLFHISSPHQGWSGPRPSKHHDFIQLADFPTQWLSLSITVEIEAKAKELAVQRLRDELAIRVPNECETG